MTARKDTRQFTIRLELEAVDRIDAHAKRLERQTPGLAVSRAAATRALLLDALTRAERQGRPLPPRTRQEPSEEPPPTDTGVPEPF